MSKVEEAAKRVAVAAKKHAMAQEQFTRTKERHLNACNELHKTGVELENAERGLITAANELET